MHYMELGGAERALLGLLYAIDSTKYDVDLFINQHTGPFMKLIPDNINLLPENPAYASIECPLTLAIRRKQFGVAFGRIIARLRYKCFMLSKHLKHDATGMQFVFDEVIKHLPSLHYLGEYDLAIAFIDPPHVIQDKVLAKKKVEWIHTDFSSRQRHYDVEATYKRWAANDNVIAVSDGVAESFLIPFPSLKDKIVTIQNIIPKALVEKQAAMAETPEYKGYEDYLKICSVGRLADVKNFHNIPVVAKNLKDKGLKFHWWIVGPGDVDAYNNISKDNCVEDFVSFIGSRDNPYPYMKQCDLYVQPSKREGKSVTVQEAQMLGKPVLITRYSTSAYQVEDGKDGIICEMDNASIAKAIVELTADNAKMQKLGKQASEMHSGNNEEIEKLVNLI